MSAFLSNEWIDAAKELRNELLKLNNNSNGPKLRVNLVITNTPFDETPINAHLDTSSGIPEIDLGHLDKSDLRISLDYTTAKSLLIDGSAGAAMEAMQLGRMKVEGGMMKMMALARLSSNPASKEAARKLREITD